MAHLNSKEEEMKTIGWILMIIGGLLVLGTIGQSDYETMNIVSPSEMMPTWQFISQLAGGLVVFYLGHLLRKEGERRRRNKLIRRVLF